MRKYTSLILALAFIIVSVTGLQMDMGGGGKPPQVKTIESNVSASEVNVPRQSSFYPKKAHEVAGYIFIIAGVAHLFLNKNPMLSYIKKK